MPTKLKTKLMFAQHLEQQLCSVPLEKTRITTISKNCGTAPSTFYNHFRDKYELAAWIFIYDFTASFLNENPWFTVEHITASLGMMNGRKTVYQKLYTTDSRNYINQYIQMFAVRYTADAVCHVSNKSVTTEQMRVIKYTFYGMRGIIEEWLMRKDQSNILELALFLFEHTPDFIKKAFDRYPFRLEELLK